MKNLKSIFAAIAVIAILFTSCRKDESIKPVISHSIPVPSATCVANDTMQIGIFLLNSPINNYSCGSNCFALIKCSDGSILDTVKLENGSTTVSTLDTAIICNNNIQPSNKITVVYFDSTNTNTIEVYNNTILLAKLSINSNGVINAISYNPSIGVSTCVSMFGDPTFKGIFIY